MMGVACAASLVLSVVAINVGAQAPAPSTLQLVCVLAGMVLFAVGAVLMVVVAAGKDPVLPDAAPWTAAPKPTQEPS